MQKTFLACFAALLTTAALGQTDTSYRFLDGNLNPTGRDGASYTAITLTTKMDDGNYQVQDFFYRTGKKLRTFYLLGTDSTKRVGPYRVYHENGEIRQRGTYKNGQKIGAWVSLSDKRTLTDSCFFNDAGNIQGFARSWFPEGQLMDSAYFHPDSAGRAKYLAFYQDGKIRGEGQLHNEDKEGRWVFYYPSGKVSSEEYYEHNEIRRMTCLEEDGTPSKGDCKPEIDAYFAAGLDRWQQYIVNAIQKRGRMMIDEEASGTAVVQFIIDTDGKIKEAKIQESSGTKLDGYALDIIQKAPSWVPARQHNRLVKAYRRQPITFRIQ